ncbi:MAG: type II secretion system protein GspM, partial [Methylomonas sp.]
MNDIHHKRWIALAVLVLLISILTLSIIYPLFSIWIESYQQKSELVFKLQKQQSILDIKDTIADNLESVRKQFQAQN